MPKVFVAGPVSWNRLVELDHLPEPRPHTVFARGHRTTLGGTSAGKALNLAHLGAEVTLRTVVGDDEEGRLITEALTAAGVELIAEVVPKSEQHLNLMTPEGGRLSIYLELPSLTTPAHDSRALEALAAADAAVIDLADPARPFLAAARERGVPVWCDVHDYDGESAFQQDFVAAADHLFLNDDGMSESDLLAFLQKHGRAVATQGAKGATAVVDGETHHVDAVPVQDIVDTNGAGDAFFSGYLVAHLAGADTPTALRAGAEQAALCLGSPDLAPRRTDSR